MPNTDRVDYNWRLKKLFKASDFNGIVLEKSTSTDVKNIDEYAYIFDNGNGTAITEHKLENNKTLIINYTKINSNWIIKNKNVIEDSSNFSRIKLTKELLT